MNYESRNIGSGYGAFNGADSNTNAQYISQKLNSIGIDVYYHSVVGDNSGRLKESLLNALNRCDLVIMAGGLGPTQDDLTGDCRRRS